MMIGFYRRERVDEIGYSEKRIPLSKNKFSLLLVEKHESYYYEVTRYRMCRNHSGGLFGHPFTRTFWGRLYGSRPVLAR